MTENTCYAIGVTVGVGCCLLVDELNAGAFGALVGAWGVWAIIQVVEAFDD